MEKQTHPVFSAGSKNPFASRLKELIDSEYFKNKISRYGNMEMYTKTAILFTAFFVLYACIIASSRSHVPWFLCVLEGLTIAGVGFCVMHDANHGSYSANKKVNNILSYSLNLVGGVNFIWQLQHNFSHHTYTNIDGHDHDIEVPYILRFSPQQKWYWWQRFQFLYVIPVYAVYYFLWIFILDPYKYYTFCKENKDKKSKLGIKIHLNFFLTKIFILFMWIVIPKLVLGFVPWVALLIIGMTCSIVISLVFQLAHTVEGTQFPSPDEKGVMQEEFAVHQVKTTSNFSPKSFILDWYLGGLNHQVEHHLFPRICHVHYKKISVYVEKTCKEFNVTYNCHKNLISAIWSHFVFLFRMGNSKSFRLS